MGIKNPVKNLSFLKDQIRENYERCKYMATQSPQHSTLNPLLTNYF
jgi:hypothetical protein